MSMLAGAPDAADLRARWGWFVGIGIVMVILGIVALGNIVDATLVTTVVVGIAMLVGGVLQIVGALTGSKTVGWRILGFVLGILYLVVGFDLIADPLRGAVAIAWVVGFFLLAGGIIRIITALMDRPDQWGLLVVIGIINIILGGWLLTGIPFTAPAIGLFVGIDLVIGGIFWVILGWNAKSAPSAVPGTAAA